MFRAFFKQVVDRILNFNKYRSIKKMLKMGKHQPGYSNIFENPFYYVDADTFYYGYKDIFENEPYKFNSLNKDPLIIDCGANIGLSVVYLKRQYPQSRVIAFEPDPDIFNTLTKNIALNELKNVELHNEAIWIDNATIDFEVEGGFSGRINKYQAKNNLITVNTHRLKDLLDQPVDLLKIDIEGAEFEVLKDCGKNLSVVKNLFVEYHSHINETQKLGELLQLLSDAGFRYHVKDAYTVKHPFIETGDMLGMDLQLNIFAINAVNDHS